MRYRILLVCTYLLALACQQEGEQPSRSSVPKSNGDRLDVLVVAKDGIWEDVAGETFRKYFTAPQPGLPQAEPVFTVHQVEPSELNELLRRARNIIFLQEGDENDQLRHDVYAKPQMLFRLSAPDETALAKLVVERQKEMISSLRESEIELLQKRLIKDHHPIPPTLTDHNVRLKIPKDYELQRSQENLMVFWKQGLRSDQGIIIYFEPLDESDAVIGDRVIPLRDSLTELYIHGEREGSYMQVEGLIAPTFESIEVDGHFAIETRGLWRTEGDFKGGAFINYSIFDETNNQRIMLDGFVFAPELNKRDLLLELEAILLTFKTLN